MKTDAEPKQDVMDELEWEPDVKAEAIGVAVKDGVVKPSVKPTDIKTKIESAFQRNALLDARQIRVETRGDKVILQGTVHSYAEKEEAQRAACSAPGICEVENNIIVSF